MKTVERADPGQNQWTELSAAHVARYLKASEFASGRRVLDAGCGTGYGASLLKMAGAEEVVGVDIDPETIHSANCQFADAAVKFLVDDCEKLQQVSGPFGLICCFESIEHLAHPERFLRRAGELLSHDGVLLVSTPDRAATPPFVDGRPRNPFHIYEWYRQEFEALLAAHYSNVEMRVQVESVALSGRLQAVRTLRQGLMWSNPLSILLWRKWPLARRENRSWKKLSGLAAPAISDYPIVPLALAPIFGTPWVHFAICRRAICGDDDGGVGGKT
ncbi:MAG: methyltransferase domain-containing protein [Planctomycetes bacterium]|nr:methyltransferase domain-containing protein [Planctomycetota bacterium]